MMARRPVTCNAEHRPNKERQRLRQKSWHRDKRLYTTFTPFGKSHHISILLIPPFKENLKQEVPVTRSMRKWSNDADAKLQDCFASTDWNVFSDSFNGIEEFSTSVTGFINKCIDDAVPTVTVRTYPNQNPWITGNIRTELKARTSAFKQLDTNPDAYKKSCYALRQSVKTGLKLNPTTPALTLIGCGRACKLLRTAKGKPAVSCPVTRACQMG